MDYRWVVRIDVDPYAVANGMDLTSERVLYMIRDALTVNAEITVKVLSAPPPGAIKSEQGES
jgi:hypothetical protein